MRDRKPDTTEIDDWTDLLRLLVLPTNEYSAVQREILDAIKLLRHKAIQVEIIEIDELWYQRGAQSHVHQHRYNKPNSTKT